MPLACKTPIRQNVNLASYCTMKVGGPARFFAEPSTEAELLELLSYAKDERIPYQILGKGSNTIFPDNGFPGLIITTIHYESEKISADEENGRMTSSAGVHLYRLVLAARDHHLGGAEFLANIPGTLGGALYMNAGFSRHPGQRNEIGDITWEVDVLSPDGEKKRLPKNELAFSYRSSNLRELIILGATLQLWHRNKDEVQKEIDANFEYRNRIQDMRYSSSGSIFKNPTGTDVSAGQLIDRCGLKNFSVGDAAVSDRHANYIVNKGKAKSSEIVQLIKEIQRRVFESTGVHLETEVKVIEGN